MTKYDSVNHPKHYVESAVSVEPIELLRTAPFDLGCAMKYMLRYNKKGTPKEDLKKALWYLNCVEESCEFRFELYNEFIRNNIRLIYRFFPYVRSDFTLCYSDVVECLRRMANDELNRITREKSK